MPVVQHASGDVMDCRLNSPWQNLAKGAHDCQYHSGIERRILKSGRMYNACETALDCGCNIQIDIKINLLIRTLDLEMLDPKMTPQVGNTQQCTDLQILVGRLGSQAPNTVCYPGCVALHHALICIQEAMFGVSLSKATDITCCVEHAELAGES